MITCPAALYVVGLGMALNVNAVTLLLMVATAAAEVGAPAPVAVALFEMLASFRSSCEIVYVLVQVVLAPEDNVVPAGPQLNVAGLINPSVTVNWVGPNVVVPLFFTMYVKVMTCPAWLYVVGLAVTDRDNPVVDGAGVLVGVETEGMG